MGENRENAEYKERTLTFVLESVLDFIIRSYEEVKVGGQLQGKIVYKFDDEPVAKELKQDNIHDIFNHVFPKIKEKCNKDPIQIEFDGYENFKPIEYKLYVDYKYFHNIESSITKEKPTYSKVFSDSIEHSFIDKELKNDLIAGLKNFTDKADTLAEGNLFPSISHIDEYLGIYYKLLTDLMEGDFVRKRIVKKDFLQELLMFYNIKSDSNIECMSLYSPIVLNNLQKMYRGVIDFYVTLFSSLKTEPLSMEMVYMYRSILIAKVQRIFRWFVYDGELKYLAIPPRPLGDSICNIIRMGTKKLKDCNSFEGIGELRFAEKIVEAYEKFSDKDKNGTLKIALIGDINYPFEELKKYVEGRITDIKIEYKIFTKNSDLEKILKEHKVIFDEQENGKKNEVTVDCGSYDEILQSTEKMDEVLNENHVVFFLDCIGLYEEVSVYEEKGIESSMQLYRLNPYNAYSNWADDPQNIFVSNPLDNLYHSIVAYMSTGRFGQLEKKPKKQVLEYIESKIKGFGKDEFKLVYVYVSDLKAFENIYCREQYYMRVEQYNEKKIGIIRFSTLKEEPLDNRNTNMIVLSVWQIIKHIALEDRVRIINRIKVNAEIPECDIDCCSLHNMYIGLDYSNWKDSIKVYYNYDLPDTINLSECEKFIKHFIKYIFMQVFKKPKGSIYQRYCKDVIVSFLYGDSKSIEDIMFVHLLRNDKVNLKNVIWNEHEEKSKKVLDNRNPQYRFSNKRLYDLAMQCYDGITVNILDEFKVTILFEEEGISKQTFKEKILLACENIDYKDSNMYANCL